jgi:hypothetical protein
MWLILLTFGLTIGSILMLKVIDIKGHHWWDGPTQTMWRTRAFGFATVMVLLFVVTVFMAAPASWLFWK